MKKVYIMYIQNLQIYENLPDELIHKICGIRHKSLMNDVCKEIHNTQIMSEYRDGLYKQIINRHILPQVLIPDEDQFSDYTEEHFINYYQQNNLPYKVTNICSMNSYMKYIHDIYLNKLLAKYTYFKHLYDAGISHFCGDTFEIYEAIENKLNDLNINIIDVPCDEHDILIWIDSIHDGNIVDVA